MFSLTFPFIGQSSSELNTILEIAHFMNWPNLCPLHELASTLAHFTNWAILCSFSAHFMNWADLYVAFEVRLLAP
jgi:hypothetical protein